MESKIPVVRRNAFSYLLDKDYFKLLRKKTLTGIRCDLGKYDYTEGNLLPQARRELKKRANTGKVDFLDAGAGKGRALVEAEGIAPNIYAHGLALNKPDGTIVSPDKWTRGHFETTVFPGKFHIIQANYSLMHAANYALALENLLNSLRKNGKLIVHGPTYSTPHNPIYELTEYERKKFLKTLKAQGFSYTHIHRADGRLVEIFTNKTGRGADLSKYYESGGINEVPLSKNLPKITVQNTARSSASSSTPWRLRRCRREQGRTRRTP